MAAKVPASCACLQCHVAALITTAINRLSLTRFDSTLGSHVEHHHHRRRYRYWLRSPSLSPFLLSSFESHDDLLRCCCHAASQHIFPEGRFNCARSHTHTHTTHPTSPLTKRIRLLPSYSCLVSNQLCPFIFAAVATVTAGMFDIAPAL